jgi:hypothetical protein
MSMYTLVRTTLVAIALFLCFGSSTFAASKWLQCNTANVLFRFLVVDTDARTVQRYADGALSECDSVNVNANTVSASCGAMKLFLDRRSLDLDMCSPACDQKATCQLSNPQPVSQPKLH